MKRHKDQLNGLHTKGTSYKIIKLIIYKLNGLQANEMAHKIMKRLIHKLNGLKTNETAHKTMKLPKTLCTALRQFKA